MFTKLTSFSPRLMVVFQLRNQTTNGNFGPWAPWQPCNNDDGVDGVSSCLCRSRSCDSPAPRCGGKNCEGPTIEVSNCSRWEKKHLYTEAPFMYNNHNNQNKNIGCGSEHHLSNPRLKEWKDIVIVLNNKEDCKNKGS